jgi:hypothetical protein
MILVIAEGRIDGGEIGRRRMVGTVGAEKGGVGCDGQQGWGNGGTGDGERGDGE